MPETCRTGIDATELMLVTDGLSEHRLRPTVELEARSCTVFRSPWSPAIELASFDFESARREQRTLDFLPARLR
jgi:hypothetical protein